MYLPFFFHVFFSSFSLDNFYRVSHAELSSFMSCVSYVQHTQTVKRKYNLLLLLLHLRFFFNTRKEFTIFSLFSCYSFMVLDEVKDMNKIICKAEKLGRKKIWKWKWNQKNEISISKRLISFNSIYEWIESNCGALTFRGEISL